MMSDGQIRSALVRWEREAAPRERRTWYRFRNQIAATALFGAYVRRARVRGHRACRPILEAAMLRYDIINPHLYGERGRRAA